MANYAIKVSLQKFAKFAREFQGTSGLCRSLKIKVRLLKVLQNDMCPCPVFFQSLKSRAANEQKWAAKPPTARAIRLRKGQTRLRLQHQSLNLSPPSSSSYTPLLPLYYTSKDRCFQELGYFIPLSTHYSPSYCQEDC